MHVLVQSEPKDWKDCDRYHFEDEEEQVGVQKKDHVDVLNFVPKAPFHLGVGIVLMGKLGDVDDDGKLMEALHKYEDNGHGKLKNTKKKKECEKIFLIRLRF